MEFNFKGKRALVTGAGKGIGRAISKALAAGGAMVFAVSRSKEPLESLVAECPDINIICCDISQWDSTRSAIESLGPIDLLVNNAGANALHSFLEVTVEACDKLMDVNLKAVLNISQVVAKSIISRGGSGSIVNISSQASQRALQDHTAYCASKGGLDQLTKVMALELGPKNIRVNAVRPTVVMTDLGKVGWSDPKKAGSMMSRIPLGRFAEIEDVVDPVLYLLSDRSAMIHGTTIPVDGGFCAH